MELTAYWQGEERRTEDLCIPHSYGMRFIAKVLKDSLHEKFPDAGEDELLKVRPKAGTFFPFR